LNDIVASGIIHNLEGLQSSRTSVCVWWEAETTHGFRLLTHALLHYVKPFLISKTTLG